MLVRQLFDPALAQYAYLIGCPRSGEAIIIDPERDIDRYYAAAAKHKLKIVAAADTHIHADYLSGLREFAERGVKVYASDEGGQDWRYEWLLDSTYDYRLLKHNDRFKVGNIEFVTVHTPGHTPEHIAFEVIDHGSGATEPVGVITGDFVFVGDLGRPDLLEEAAGHSGSMIPAAQQLYRSLARFKALPEFTQVWPAHGAGSACGKALGDVPSSTVGYELRFNPALKSASSETNFISYILNGQPEPPLYFARMKRDNKVGPKIINDVPMLPHLAPKQLATLAGRTDVAVVDTRRRTEFTKAHLPKSLLAEWEFQFANIVGSYVEEGTPIYLIIDDARVEDAVRILLRIGHDHLRGYFTPTDFEAYRAAGGQVSTLDAIDMPEMERRREKGGVRVLDVRGKVDFDVARVTEAQNIAHTRLLARMSELPNDAPVLVHCASGARAVHASALLARHGYSPTTVSDNFTNWQTAAVR
ncbi:MAG: MBL fold metallo-hydrolase [Gemmatimonadaceae bacterium]|nr:MBL fold metallo-hydrolase [Gemmatimonadaceae bacterium]